MTENRAAVARPPIEALLAEEDFVRGLARGLVQDAAAVDDVVQQAWLQAMQRPPRRPAALRHWLAIVVRNLVRNRHAAEANRGRRERHAAVDEAVPSTGAVLEREELRRQVVAAALALPEPYRGTVLLRYFEDLTPTEIAARLAISGSTVRTRLQRGLQMLRGSLDADFGGDRRAWCLAVIPLARPRLLPIAAATATTGSVIGWFTLGGLTMKKTAVAAIGATLLLGGAFAVVISTSDDPGVDLPNGAASRVATADAAPTPVSTTVPDAARATTGTAGTTARRSRPGTPAPDPVEFAGILHDHSGNELADVPYWFEPGPLEVDKGADLEFTPPPSGARRTDQQGRFEVRFSAPRSEERTGLLWFDTAGGVRVACIVDQGTRRDWRRVELPPSGEVTVRAYRLPVPTARWHVELAPARLTQGRRLTSEEKRAIKRKLAKLTREEKRNGERQRLLRLLRPRPQRHETVEALALARDDWHGDPTHPDFLVAFATRTPEFRGKYGGFRLVRGLTYGWEISGDSFSVLGQSSLTADDGPRTVQAGGSLSFAAADRIPSGDLRVLEPNGSRPTAMPGRVTTGPLYGQGRWRDQIDLRAGRARLGHEMLKPDTTVRVWVTMADGEVFEQPLAVTGNGEQTPIELFRGSGLQPVLIAFNPPDSKVGRLELLAEDGGGKLHPGVPWNEFDFADDEFAVGFAMAGFGKDGLVRLIRPPNNLTHLWLLASSGHVATSNRISGHWLPVRALRALDIKRTYFKHGRRKRAEVEFQIQLVHGSGRRSWRTLDRVELTRKTRVFPRWEKFAPVRFRYRFVMRVERQPPFELEVAPR